MGSLDSSAELEVYPTNPKKANANPATATIGLDIQHDGGRRSYSRRGNPIATWLLGGLNYHVEHRTFLAGLAAHYRWLHQMGRGENCRQASPDEGSVAF